MIKNPLVIAILGAVLLVFQQYQMEPHVDFKVVGMAALIAGIGAAGNFLKGKGTTNAGIIGTVLLTFTNIQQSGSFTWNEFIYTSLIGVIMLIAPTVMPVPAPQSKDTENKP